MNKFSWLVPAILLLPATLAFDISAFDQPRSGFSANQTISVQDTAVYKTGYVSENGTEWNAITLTGDVQKGDWVLGQASSDENLTNIRYVAVYSCTWSGAWSCSETWQVKDRGPQQPPAEDENQTNTSEPGPGSLQADYDALQDLYASTGGDEWWDNSGWESMTPETMGDAYGITVYPDGHEFAGRVKEIDLFQNNLVGTLPPEIGNLKKTTHLKLKQPLTQEEFAASDPEGQIATNPPPKLRGTIPARIGEMTELEWLSLGGQYRDIDIETNAAWNEANHGPGHGSIGKRYVAGNRLSGALPPELGNLKNLEMLEIRRQELSGPIPPELGNLENLKGLFLNGRADVHDEGIAALTGEIPSELANLRNIRHLHLSSNYLQGSIPQELNKLTQLRHLRLGRNQLTGTVPEFDGPTDLRVFKLQRNDLTGPFPDAVFRGGRNTYLNLFDISWNDMTGEIPEVETTPNHPASEEVGYDNYHSMSIFSVTGNDFTGPVPEWIDTMHGHIQFKMNYNNFDGPIPVQVASGPKLRLYEVEWSDYSGELPEATWVSENLLYFKIFGNDLEGPIPDSWESLKNSKRLSLMLLDRNRISGELPRWLGELEHLERLEISENRFSFADLLPNLPFIDSQVPDFGYVPQKPFGNARTYDLNAGSSLTLDDFNTVVTHPDNAYQWYQDGSDISGATSREHTLNDVQASDAGTYTLQVTNPNIPELTLTSEPITVNVS